MIEQALFPVDAHQRQMASLATMRRALDQLQRNAGTQGAGTITSDHLVAGAVTTGSIAAGAITTELLAAGAVTATTIAAGTITGDRIAGGTITGNLIQAGTLTASHVQAASITGDRLVANTITATQIAANAITSEKIAANTIVAGDIAAATITATQIATASLTGAVIAGGTITATNIATGTLTGSLLAAATITGDKIVTGSITASHISVTNLAAISADLGSITAGTITGATIRTAASGQRAEISAVGFRLIDAAGVITFHADTATGKVIALAGLGGPNLLRQTAPTAEDWAATPRWSPNNCTVAIETAVQLNGFNTFKLTSDGAGSTVNIYNDYTSDNVVAVEPGDEIVASASMRTAVASRTARLRVIFYDSANAQVGSVITGTSKALVDAWTRFELPATAPAGAAKVRLLTDYLMPAATAGEVAYVGGAQIERGRLATSYAPRPDEITVDRITTSELQDGLFSTEPIVDQFFAPAVVHGDRVVAASITAGNIAASTITTVQIAAATITGGDIAAGTITAANVQAGSITADRLNVSVLSAITADLGTITAGTITGALIRTASSGARIEFSSTEFAKLDASGNKTVRITPADGLDLLAGDSTTPPNDRKIRWLSAGDLTLEIGAWEHVFGFGGRIKAFSADPLKDVDLHVITQDGTGSQAAGIGLHWDAGTDLAWIEAIAEAESKKLLDHRGVSDWAYSGSHGNKFATHTGAELFCSNAGELETMNQTISITAGWGADEVWEFFGVWLGRSDSANDTVQRGRIVETSTSTEVAVAYNQRLYYGTGNLQGHTSTPLLGRYTVPAGTTRTFELQVKTAQGTIGSFAFAGGSTHNAMNARRIQ